MRLLGLEPKTYGLKVSSVAFSRCFVSCLKTSTYDATPAKPKTYDRGVTYTFRTATMPFHTVFPPNPAPISARISAYHRPKA